ncbi:class I adenylate-forming enzyme family protein [Catellatospora sichuanensis]|uniref:class I adenylate-forming enzyme family protein n=1 Tax=Catellatospora sichuanensis TaxID=1969805 RepID=UPI001C905D05|nr:AMP-binding protein [Catellatospora sichuanensis]
MTRPSADGTAALRTVPGLLALRAAEDPDAVALAVDGHDTLTYDDWQRRAADTARGLTARGLRPGDRVGLVFDTTEWTRYAVAYCAVQIAGGVAVPLSAARAPDDLRAVLAQCRASGVLHGTAVTLATPPPCVAWTADDEGGPADAADPLPLGPGDLAQILYTSGTTGQPKGVGAAHANLTSGFVARRALRPLAHSRHAVHAFPIGTNAGQNMLLNALIARPAVVAMARFDAARWCELIDTLRAGTAFLVPAMAIDLLRCGTLAGADLSSLRLLGCTAAALPGPVAAALAAAVPNATIVNYYTSTEAAPAQTTMVFDPRRPAAVGRPAAPGDLAIRADDGSAAQPGQPGAVWLRSPTTPRHYVDDPEATKAVFADGWVRMGDVGHLDADGYLHLIDRESDLVVTGAHKVSSLRVEEALHTHPSVVEAAVVPVAHPVLGATVGAVVTARAHIEPAELRAHLADRLARHEIPTHVAVVDALPRNEAGKVIKRDLGTVLHPRVKPAATPSATPGERRLAAFWREILRTRDDDVTADFFALGGDSLRAAQLATRAGQAWQVEVTVDDVFAHPSVRALATWLDEQTNAAGPSTATTTATTVEPTAIQQVWLAERAADPPRHVVPIHVALRVDEPFDHDVWHHCLEQLVARHDALRTPVGPADAGPTLHTARRTARTVIQAAAEAAGFVTDASTVPVRALTLDIAPERHVLVLSIDHLRCDGWSLGILLRELGLLYSAARHAGANPLRPPAATAGQAAQWARQQWPRHREFWQRLLGPPIADPAPLPGQHAHSQAYHGASHTFTVPTPTVAALRTVARTHRTTMMRMTLAVWAATLRRTTGSAELAFLSPLTGRIRPEWEHVVGCLIQQPVIRVALHDDPTPAQLLQRVHRQAADATEHQFHPLHEFIDRIAHPAYFFYEPWARAAHLPGMRSAQLDLPPELGLRWAVARDRPDLSPPRLRLVERTGDVLQAQLVYNRHALPRAAVESLAEEFLRTCQRFVRISPDPVRAVPAPATSRPRSRS